VVAGRTRATESGQLYDVIGLLNEDSGRRLRGRVVGEGEVEVVR
jgi:flagella basal body P-ring formation protein FlgA